MVLKYFDIFCKKQRVIHFKNVTNVLVVPLSASFQYIFYSIRKKGFLCGDQLLMAKFNTRSEKGLTR